MSAHTWTPIEIAVLREHYADTPTETLARALGLSVKQVYIKAYSLRLRKSSAFKASHWSACIKPGERRSPETEFKPGVPTWNKGKNFVAGGRSVETQFKPGQKPHTWNPIGHERITDDGYLQRKLTDTGITRRDYVAVHHILWREAGREIPPGHALVFRDGNKRNVTLDNLELVTRAELMARNSRHRLPKEINDVIAIRAAIQRRINRITREQTQDEHQHD